MRSNNIRHQFLTLLINACRFLLAASFIFSGFVKAIDPNGTSYKITEYLVHFSLAGIAPTELPQVLSVALCSFEFIIGIYFFFGIRRRFTCMAAFVFLIPFTFLTLYLWIANPVADCGCFGDAIKLTNAETFLKNVVLLLALVIVSKWWVKTFRIITEINQWVISLYSALFIVLFSLYSMHYEPIVDFRPYFVGADIKKSMEIPAGAPQREYQTTFILQKDGKQKEFTLENYPDSSWTFIDSRTVIIKEGYEPAIKDFHVSNSKGEEVTDEILNDTSFMFVLISPHFSKADDGNIDRINAIYDYCSDNGYKFICLTASTNREINDWRDKTGSEYPIYFSDDVTLRTIVRSNPGIILLKDGKVYGKWSGNKLIDDEELNSRIENLAIYGVNDKKQLFGLLKVLLLYLLPLLFFTLADQIWAGIKYYKKYKVKSLIKSKEQ